ncbi:methyl-accepting chemotaxis protein [Mangrovitalea sediminis]|uniref:methyl-accepting chemotaxis protein n=1 Tax=Mangrovitalea sediminis TaxID=1982043 RepID=UPI000BE4E68D|nr:methyl-accepting chemotaxis protein [Mangrovitalea sediminis]
MQSNLLKPFASRLVLPVYLALLIMAAVQVAFVVVMTNHNVDALRNGINSRLETTTAAIDRQMDQTRQKITGLITGMTQQVNSDLQSTLKTHLDKEGATVSDTLQTSLANSSKTLADVLAEIAVPSVWNSNTPELTRLARMAQNDPNVIFAVFLDRDKKPLTRYLDRTKDEVKQLIGDNPLHSSVLSLLAAAPQDTKLNVVKVDVTSDGVAIGQFIMGVSKAGIEAKTAELQQRFSALIKQVTTQTTQTMNQAAQGVTEPLTHTLGATKQHLTDATAKVAETISQGTGALIEQLSAMMVIAALALIVVLAILMASRIVSRLNNLRDAVWDIAEGDGDLTRRLPETGRDELTETARGLNRFVERTQQTLQEVHSATGAATNLIASLASAAEEADQSAETQRAELSQVSTAIHQMSASIQQMAASIQSAASHVDTIRSDTESTAAIGRDVTGQLNQLQARVTESVDVIHTLDRHCGTIGSVLDVILGIAEQTNLLALNAAIEAARAGESGRGFAVVADEVRALASKTQDSTSEIRGSIQSLQQGSQSAVSSIEQASDMAAKGCSAFAESDRLQNSVNQSISQLFDMTTEVASMAEQQSAVAEEINRNALHISEAAETTTAAINRAAATSQQMREAMQELEKNLARFRI